MPEINEAKAKKFLEGIKEDESVVVIHHDDLDGFASGMLFYDFAKTKTKEVDHISFTYGDDQSLVLKKVKKHDKIIITDLGPGAIPEILDGLGARNVLYVDHHQKEKPIPRKILEYRTVDQGYIPCARTAYELCGGKRWLGAAGVMADMGHKYKENDTFLKSFFSKHKISQKQFLENVVYIINKFLVYFIKKQTKAFKMLHKIKEISDVKKLKKYARPVEREIQKYVTGYKKEREVFGLVNYYQIQPKYSIKSTISTMLGEMYPHDLIIIAGVDGDRIKLSSRTQNPKANMITVLHTGMKGLENANGGGHIRAAGGIIQKKDLEQFKTNIATYKF